MPSTPLISPKTYFANHENPFIAGIAVFILTLLGAIVLFIANLNLLLDRTENVPDGLSSAINSLLGTTLFVLIIFSIISLLVIALIMHYGSGGSKTDGTFGNAVAVAGWSYAPDLLAVPLSYAITRYYLADMTFDASDMQAFAAEMEVLDGPLGILDGLLALGIVAWSVYILCLGTAGTHDVSYEETIFPALLIGIGSLLFRLIF